MAATDGFRAPKPTAKPSQISSNAPLVDQRADRLEATKPTIPDESYTEESSLDSSDDTEALNQPRIPPSLTKRRRNREEGISRLLAGDYITASLHWTMAFIGTMMKIIQLPLAVVASLIVLSWVCQHSVLAIAPMICCVPGSSYLEICKPTPTIPRPMDPFFQNVLIYESRLGEMQEMGANTVELPYYLRLSEGSVRGMIIQLSAINTKSKDKLMPLLSEYRILVDRAIDGLQDWLSRIDQVVDRTILINSWTESQLLLVEKHHSSPLASVNRLISKMVGHPEGALSTEAEVREAFAGLTENVLVLVDRVIQEAQVVRRTLAKLNHVLESIAVGVLSDKDKLEKEKLSEESYWRLIMRSYREKMSGFDSKMEMCGRFYRLTEQAFNVVSTTELKLQQMRGELLVFGEGLKEVPLQLDGGRTVSLQLYIDMLKAGAKNLEATRKSTKLLQEDRMRKLQEVLYSN